MADNITDAVLGNKGAAPEDKNTAPDDKLMASKNTDAVLVNKDAALQNTDQGSELKGVVAEGQVEVAGDNSTVPGSTETLKPATFDNDPQMEWLKKYFAKSLGIYFGPPDIPLLDEISFEGVARYIASDKCNKIVVMTGAGISTSAGIPDFRSPGTGVYERLKEEYNVENPQELFTYSFFKKNPEPYYKYRKELWRFEYKPTPCHYFIRLIEKKNKLLRHFTQNIDSLEILAGISEDRLVQAHGTIHTGHCMECKKQYTGAYIKEQVFGSDGPVPKCEEEDCGGIVRPDIVMFEENLPKQFSERVSDIDECDCLLILGTSLVVRPFSNLPIRTRDNVPRLYINKEEPKVAAHPINALFFGGGFDFFKEDNIRDVFWQGSCDDGCYSLADMIGWGDELRQLVKEENARLDIELNIKPQTTAANKKSLTDAKVSVKQVPEKKQHTSNPVSGKVNPTKPTAPTKSRTSSVNSRTVTHTKTTNQLKTCKDTPTKPFSSRPPSHKKQQHTLDKLTI